MNTKQLPKNWQEVELGEIFIFENKSGRKAGEGSENGKYKFFTSSSKQSKLIDIYNYEGEHLIFSSGGQEAVHYCNEKFSASNDCFVVRVDKILTKYIFYYLSFKIWILAEGFKGAGLKHISGNYLKKIKIIYPENKDIQKKIVSILEKAEKLKQKRAEADKLTKEYLQSVFYEMFGDKFEVRNLDEIANIIMGQSPPGDSYNESKDGMPFFQGRSEFTDKYPIIKKWTTMPSKIVLPNSILISVRAPVGSTNLCNIKCCIGRGLASINPMKEVTLEYLYSWFKLNEENISNLGSGSTFKAINSKQLATLKIPIPPIKLQQKFAKIVQYIEKLNGLQEQSKEKIDEQFNSLMQKTFSGELVK